VRHILAGQQQHALGHLAAVRRAQAAPACAHVADSIESLDLLSYTISDLDDRIIMILCTAA
jgi:hypothetical protein